VRALALRRSTLSFACAKRIQSIERSVPNICSIGLRFGL
jgi:hypothetical protein